MNMRTAIMCGVALGVLSACAPVLTSTKTNSTEVSPRAETHPDLTYYLPEYFYRITFGPKKAETAPVKDNSGGGQGGQQQAASDKAAGKGGSTDGGKKDTKDENKDGSGTKQGSGGDQVSQSGGGQSPAVKSRAVTT